MDKEKAERIQSIFNWVRFIILVLFLAFVFIGLSKAQTSNDFGMWVSAGAEKNLSDRLNLGVSTELRTKDNTMSVDRWQLGVSGTYKVCKYLKLGGGYEFHLKNRMVDDVTETIPRHRLMFDITPGGKVFGWLKLSLRERYQYTFMMQKANLHVSHEHYLRSRFMAEVSNSKMKEWNPFVSVEMFNILGEQLNIDEIRMAVGTTYSLNAHHIVNIGYLLDLKRSAEGFCKAIHALTLGYVYKL